MTITIPSSTASYYLSASGTIASNAGTRGQSITGQPIGIYLQGSNDTLVNTGTIIGGFGHSSSDLYTGVAVNNGTGDVIINQVSGLIENTYSLAAGIVFNNGVGTVTNAGRIIAGVGSTNGGNGIDMDAGGFVTNLATGTISQGGVYSGTAGIAGTVINSGQIIGDSVYGGVFLAKGGVITNLAGTISANGAQYGIKVSGGAGTITNAATIAASNSADVAITMASGFANRVIDQSGGVFIGTVNGGSNATMELGSSANAGTLTATADQFTNFSALYIDPGARWLIKGDSSLSSEFSKIGGFAFGDEISLTGLAQTPTTFSSSVAVDAGTTTTSVIIKAGSTGLETLTLLGSIASGQFDFVAGTTSTLSELGTPPVITAGGTVTFNGGGAAVAADPGLTVTDADSSTLVSASVVIGGFISGDTLTVGNPGSLSSSFSNGTLTLEGPGSLASFQTALDSVDYGFTAGGDPTGGGSHTSRTLSWTVNDGVALSNTGTSTVETVHTAPTVIAGASVTFVQSGPAVTLDSGLTVADPDSGGDLSSATVAVSGGVFATDGDTLAAITSGTSITATYTQATETLSLTGTDTIADYQAVLRSINLSSTGATAGSRTIDWTVNDGVANSATATSTATVRDAPVVNAGGTVTFNGGGSPVPADSGLTVSDSSSSTLASATVVIGGFISGDTLTVGTPGGLTSGFSNGTLTLTGTASLATYRTALDSVDYGFAAGGDPTGGGGHTSRTLSWSINDGTVVSNTGTSTVETVHTAPTVVAGGTVSYVGGGAAVALDPGLTASDVDSGGVLASATVTIGSAVAGDTLSFTNSHPALEGNISVSSDSGGVLVLTSAGTTATVAQWETALESVTYSYSGGDPTIGGTDDSRTVSWTINDGVAVSNASISTINVTAESVSAPAITGITPDTGTSSTDGITDTGALTVDGTAANGTTIDVFNGSTLIGAGITGSLGTWTAILGTPLAAGDYTLTAKAITSGVTSGASTGYAVDVDETAPTVTSIDTVDSSSNNGGTEQFTVDFSEAVTGVSVSGFTLTDTGSVTGTIASVSSGSGSAITVTVTGAAGSGTMRLDLNSSGTGITDAAGNPISGGFTSGETYAITPAVTTAVFDAYVYTDTNGDGSQDNGEPGLAGVTVNLLDGSGNPTGQSSTTDSNGNVSFPGLAPGSYEIGVVTPAGDAVSQATNVNTPNTLSAGQTANATEGVYVPATFSVFVYDDVNANGTDDAGDAPLSGVTVNLLTGSGTPTGQSTTTNASGIATFNGLAPGSYEIAPVTTTGDVVTQSTNISTSNTLASGGSASATFGEYAPPALADATIDLTVAEGQSLGNLWSELISNGIDPAPASLSITSVGTSGTQGSVTLSTATQSLIYVATGLNPSEPVDAFTYTLTDGSGGTVTGTVDVTVTGPNLPTTVVTTPGATSTATGSGQVLISQGSGQTLAGSTAGGDDLYGGSDTTVNGHGSNNTIFVTPGNHTIAMGANNNTATLYNGNNTVTATGTGNTVTAGNGNDFVSGMTGNSTITLGNGNDSVTITGANNNITVGTGTDTISAGNGGNETVVAGDGANTISGGGAGDSFTTGNGKSKITATGANATIVGGSGGDTVTATGSGDHITTGSGNDSITVTAGSATIKAGLGLNTIKFAGSGNDVINQGGTDTLTDTGTNNTIVVPLAGQGLDTINGSVLSNGDTFDLRAALAATTWDQQLSDLGDYLTLGTSGPNALVELSVTSGGTPITIAVLNGQGSVTLSSFVSHSLLT